MGTRKGYIGKRESEKDEETDKKRGKDEEKTRMTERAPVQADDGSHLIGKEKGNGNRNNNRNRNRNRNVTLKLQRCGVKLPT